MDHQQDTGFSTNLFKWDPRASSLPTAANNNPPPYRILDAAPAPVPASSYAYGAGMMMSSSAHHHHHHQLHMARAPPPQQMQMQMQQQQAPTPQAAQALLQLDGLEELFQAYGIRYYTASKIAELGFTVNTLLDMREEELGGMINSLSHIFRWDLLVGERYGIKTAVRAERRRLQDLEYSSRHGGALSLVSADTTTHPLDAFSQEGISEERVQGEKEVVLSRGGTNWEMVAMQQQQQQVHRHERKKQKQQQQPQRRKKMSIEDEENDDEDDGVGGGFVSERQREHPFIVTEPGEVARGKKNGLDYLFHLYELCHDFLIQVQNLAKDCGDKCPTKVTNQVFRYAKKSGATYINKPKMRHYVHCYALHCLDEETSNAIRRAFKERGENVGAWRQACYKPLVTIAARQGWDIDAIFNANPRLAIWYVPTKLRQLCHTERSAAAVNTSSIGTAANAAAAAHHLPFSIRDSSTL
uniref:Floricaula/leafy-like transcription factor n=14 Tax=Persicarieae TaxID=1110384 RepID=A0AAU8BDB9_9CARY